MRSSDRAPRGSQRGNDGYVFVRVSRENAADLSRALWLAARLNDSDAAIPNPNARQAEAHRRIVADWTLENLRGWVESGASGPFRDAFLLLERAEWVCSTCDSTGLGSGGLVVAGQRVRCRECA